MKEQRKIGRDLEQVELFSEELKDRVQGSTITSDLQAATRLLAEQGVNGRKSVVLFCQFSVLFEC